MEQNYLGDVLDEHLKDVQELRRLSQKPEIVSLMRQMFATGNDLSVHSLDVAAVSTKPFVLENQTGTLETSGSNPIRKRRSKNGTLLQATEQAVRSFGSEIYLIKDVVSRMIEQGYQFKAKRPDVAVNGTVKILVNGGSVSVVEEGWGSNPAKFQNKSVATPNPMGLTNAHVPLTQ